MPKIVVVGAGVAGLTAAHELVERGFEVEVYERADYLGGKARSIVKPGSGVGGRHDLPGEHGFRFFPGFYSHITDTMARIDRADGQTAFDALVGTESASIAQVGRIPYTFPTRLFDWSNGISGVIDSLASWFRALADLPHLGLGKGETAFFASRMIDFLTTCDARRMSELENVTWWTYIRAANMSAQYRKLLAIGLTRSLVAMQAEVANTRTVGTILVQMLQGLLMPAANLDRVLSGPTGDVWINPWVEQLKARGVRFYERHRAASIDFAQGTVSGIKMIDAANDHETTASGDFYICAVPVEIAVSLINPAMASAAPSLANLRKLQVSWMNGIQFFLKRNVPIVRGHIICADSPWALTCISQPQFWSSIDLGNYGNGTVQGIISVDISNWEERGIYTTTKAAQDCSAEEIMKESWAQLLAHFSNDDDPASLRNDDLDTWLLDPDIICPPDLRASVSVQLIVTQARGLRSVMQVSRTARTLGASGVDSNIEPLLINTVGSWAFRPEARTEIPNFMLAGDYVRTFTNLATMEGANEAGRRAVNAVLDGLRSRARRCVLFPLEEPAVFKLAKAADEVLFRLGLPHVSLTPVFGFAAR